MHNEQLEAYVLDTYKIDDLDFSMIVGGRITTTATQRDTSTTSKLHPPVLA